MSTGFVVTRHKCMDKTFSVFRLSQFLEDCQKLNFSFFFLILFPSFFHQTSISILHDLVGKRT